MGGEKGWNLTCFTAGLDLGHEKKREFKDDFKTFSSN